MTIFKSAIYFLILININCLFANNVYESENRLGHFSFPEIECPEGGESCVFSIQDEKTLSDFRETSKIVIPDNEELLEISFSQSPSSIEDNDNSNILKPEWCKGLYVKKVGNLTSRNGVTVIRETLHRGEGSATCAVTETIQSTYSATISIDAVKVSAGVGFTVSKGYSISDSRTFQCAKGYDTMIRVYPRYHDQRFEIWDDGCIYDTKEGTGKAVKPVGFFFVVTRTKSK